MRIIHILHECKVYVAVRLNICLRVRDFELRDSRYLDCVQYLLSTKTVVAALSYEASRAIYMHDEDLDSLVKPDFVLNTEGLTEDKIIT